MDRGLENRPSLPDGGSCQPQNPLARESGTRRLAAKNDDVTRKSIASHYFARGGLAFYDAQGLPTILETKPRRAS